MVGNKFTVSYSIDARDIAESEVGAVLNTKKLVAEAKALLFQEKLYEAIAAAVTAIKAVILSSAGRFASYS